MKTKEEIEHAMERIQAERDTIPEHSMFGDENWRTMDAQLERLKAACADMDEDAITEERDKAYDRMDEEEGGDNLEFAYARAIADTLGWLLDEIEDESFIPE